MHVSKFIGLEMLKVLEHNKLGSKFYRLITANKILRYAEMELQKRTLSNKPGSEEGADKLVKRPSLNLNIFLVNDV